MKNKNRERLILAAETAAELIRRHAEIGLDPEDVDEVDENGMMQYVKACERISKMLLKYAKKQSLKL